MTSQVELPLYGSIRLRETSKEALLALWREVERRVQPPIRYQERMLEVSRDERGFEVRTSAGLHRARAVLLAVGRRGTPRKLGVPGEELEKVVYRLIEPEQYRGRRVLVVGGGDSALEAAVRLAEEPGTESTLAYRGNSFARARPQNRARIDEAAKQGRLRLLLETEVAGIASAAVQLRRRQREASLANDAVIVCAGGILPTTWLQSIGVAVETKFGTA
jgi:thioredoxin reductase